MLKYFRLLNLLFLIFSLLFSSCVANIYTVSQIQKREKLSEKLVNKKVSVTKYGDKVMTGYFFEVKNDSTIIHLRRKINSRIAIPNNEIKFITKYKDIDKATMAAVVFLSAIIILSAKGMAIGPSATK